MKLCLTLFSITSPLIESSVVDVTFAVSVVLLLVVEFYVLIVAAVLKAGIVEHDTTKAATMIDAFWINFIILLQESLCFTIFEPDYRYGSPYCKPKTG